MLALDGAALHSIHQIVLLWMPYYFSKLGFGSYNISITAAYVLSLPIGAFLFGFLRKKSLLKTKYLVTIFLIFGCLFFSVLMFLENS